jgi:hypothetical protein
MTYKFMGGDMAMLDWCYWAMKLLSAIYLMWGIKMTPKYVYMCEMSFYWPIALRQMDSNDRGTLSIFLVGGQQSNV